MKKFILILTLISSLTFTTTVHSGEIPSGAEMIGDILFVRPLSAVGFAVGLAGFVVLAPFSILSGSPIQGLYETGKRLVVYPFNFTFIRKVGHYPGYMEELEYISED